MNIIADLLKKYGKNIVEWIGITILPIVMDKVTEACTIYANRLFEKFKEIMTNANENINESAQVKAEELEMKADVTLDREEANILRAKAEVWHEVVDLIIKQSLLTAEQIEILKSAALAKAQNPLEETNLKKAIQESIQLSIGSEDLRKYQEIINGSEVNPPAGKLE
jgi:SUMO ligase MMS21 Smc5/6 complex component